MVACHPIGLHYGCLRFYQYQVRAACSTLTGRTTTATRCKLTRTSGSDLGHAPTLCGLGRCCSCRREGPSTGICRLMALQGLGCKVSLGRFILILFVSFLLFLEEEEGKKRKLSSDFKICYSVKIHCREQSTQPRNMHCPPFLILSRSQASCHPPIRT